jgi:hypothetical protein
MRAVVSLSLSMLVLGGCDCGGETVRLTPSAPSEDRAEDDALVIDVTVPRTERTTLLAAQPQVTLSVDVRGYRVQNGALIDTWPAPERARAAESASPIDPGFPLVDITIPASDPSPLLIPDLRDAMARAAAADRARDPSVGAPIAFALSASSEVTWGRVVRALYASAMVGYAEPSFVVRDAADIERIITVRGEHGASVAHADDRVRAALAAIGAPVTADPLDEGTATDGVPVAPPLAFVLEAHGLRVQRGLVWLNADCMTPVLDGSPAFPSAQITTERLTTCIEALSPFDRASFAAAPDVTYGRAIAIIEALALTGRPLAIETIAAPETE